MTDRLTIGDVESAMVNYGGAGKEYMNRICRQLLDTMRENEGLREQNQTLNELCTLMGKGVNILDDVRNKDSND